MSFRMHFYLDVSLSPQAETHLVFPKSASVDQLRRIRESIAAERDQRLGVGQPQQSPVTASATALAPAPASAAAQGPPVTASLAARQTPTQAPSLVKLQSCVKISL